MTRRIGRAGKGCVTLDGNILYLSNFKSISLNPLGRYEDPDMQLAWSIGLTPVNPSPENIENKVDGTTYIVYKEEEEKDFKADYKVLLKASEGENLLSLDFVFKSIIAPILVTLLTAFIIWAISKLF